MGIEKQKRARLIESLEAHFLCFEEVTLRHAFFVDKIIRADLVAFPLDDAFWGHPLAFEVKEPRGDWGSADWAKAVKQAADYVYSKIETNSNSRLNEFAGRRISASFIYPSPPVNPRGDINGNYEHIAARDIQRFSGVMQLAMHFRVGHAFDASSPSGSNRRLVLSFATNNIFRSDSGFGNTAIGILNGKRQVGSSHVDILSALDGIAENVDKPWL